MGDFTTGQGGVPAVTNNSTQENPAPTFGSAIVPAGGDTLTITFDEDLETDSAKKPANSVFTVSADDTDQTPTSLTIAGRTVTLGLGTTINRNQTVTVSYTDPSVSDDTRAIQDPDGNDAPSFTDRSVTNNSRQIGENITCTGTVRELLCADLTVGFHRRPPQTKAAPVGRHVVRPARRQRGFDQHNPYNSQRALGSLSSQSFEIGDTIIELRELVHHTFGWSHYGTPDSYVSLAFSKELPKGSYTLEAPGWRQTIRGGQNTYTFRAGDRSPWYSGDTITVRLQGPADRDTHLSRVAVNGNRLARHSIERLGAGDRRPLYSYRATIGANASRATVTAATRDADATIAYYNYSGDELCDASSDPGFQVHLKPGFVNYYSIKVTAADGKTVQTYSLGLDSGNSNKVWAAKPLGIGRGCGPSGQSDNQRDTNAPTEPGGLTASLDAAPARHDGSSAFTVRIAFSEALKNGTLGSKVVRVSGGSHGGSSRVAGAGEIWEIRVTPAGNGPVTLALVSSETCASGIACTSGDEQPLSADWSATVPGPDTGKPPLTGRFTQAPAEHDGSSAFKVRITFSEALKNGALGAKVARVTNGTNTGSTRVSGEDEVWEVTVTPAGNAGVTIGLASSGACGSGIACTADFRPLSVALSWLVQGPPGISVDDTTASESDGHIDFTVRLSRRAIGTVTVDYVTANVSAAEGEDYTKTSGTLTFASGEQTRNRPRPGAHRRGRRGSRDVQPRALERERRVHR